MNSDSMYRVVLTGGGSGGHIMPLIAVGDSLRKRLSGNIELYYVGSKGRIEEESMEIAQIPSRTIMTGKMRRYFSFQNFIDIFKIPIGFVQALWHLLQIMPDAVFSKGGHVAVPVVLAAWIYRIPVVTQDSDAVPGIATRIIGKFASRIAVAYPSAMEYFPKNTVAMVGNPIRTEILGGDIQQARARFLLSGTKPVVLVLGGSLGARAIDRAVVTILPKLLQVAEVIHQTGMAHYEETIQLAGEYSIAPDQGGYFPRSFMDIDDMKHALAVADVIVSRAGANAISEIAAVGKPAILIPLASAANDEQRRNAYEIARVGGAIVLEEGNLGENIFYQKIVDVLNDNALMLSMQQAIRVFYHPEAGDVIADEIIRLMQK